ncbi:hypothetical protein [Opitutus terrae]|uniref:Transmembrane protein n=1 Tax=Opitutus terrae (strain DSM 11246 / JCM 15787 / PB90-1) TaxID=452637 RepID=B1ZPT3_OPITP|nr:hypothetical protein [Opitutus terrae]ACB75536.1 conserved hypothetical protein [Opitutus terrae PB90-1]
MTTNALDELWRSSPNEPLADAGARLAAHFVTRLRERRRLQGWWLGWTFLALTGATALALAQLVQQGPLEFAGQGALWLLLLLPWSAAIHFLRKLLREGVPPKTSIRSLREALLAAREGNRAERRRLAVIAILLGALAPVTAVAVRQLHLAGKASVNEAWSLALVFGLALAVGGGIVAWRYRRRLVPECRRLESLLRDLESNPVL